MENCGVKVCRDKSRNNLLEVKGLTVRSQQGGKERLLLDKVNFKVKRGQFVALVGKSGIGKTLTIKAILGLLEEHYWKVEGNISFYQRGPVFCPITGKPCVGDQLAKLPMEIRCPLGRRILALSMEKCILRNGSYDKDVLSKLRGNKILAVFQGADTHLNPSISIGWQIAEAVNPRKPSKDTEDEVKRRLEKVNLDTNSLKNYPHHFSQGQRQRIMIAMALQRSDLVICDEPTSALDEKIKEAVIDIFKELRKAGEIASMILVTHDRKVIEKLEDDDIVFVMDKVKAGITIIDQVGTKVVEIKDPPLVWDGEFELPYYVHLHPLLEHKDFRWFKKPNKTNETSNKNTILSISELSQGYRQGIWRNTKSVLKKISFNVKQQEFFGIVGESGCGKTTLAKSIARLVDHTEGEILYYSKRKTDPTNYEGERRELNLVKVQPNGNKPDSDLMRELRTEIQLIFQDSASTFNPSISIQELFSETLELLDIKDPNESLTLIKENLFDLKICEDEDAITDILSKYPAELSGGERQRLAIARSFLLKPRLVIADEPFANQDKITEKEIIQMMDRMRKRDDGTTFIIISHDRELMENICDRIAIIEDGEIRL